eukprot:TRINITY_DN10977_c0_g1_i1.p1 TRINITY_DN10977_c0_g1~~TRINITY_DN10977_c0_g1_i1.p1  ORF type:complete len:216 (-),score=31.04 TRINITY_DN10977_c0_g1_i1:187-834(-)
MTRSTPQATYGRPMLDLPSLVMLGDHPSNDASTSITVSERDSGERETGSSSSRTLTTTTMEELVIQLNERYDATLEVRNTFLEFRATSPTIARIASEPTLPYVSSDPPSSGELIDDGLPESGAVVIVRDVPCKVEVERMIAELKLLGFEGCYNRINFPIRTTRGRVSGKGFGFINFNDASIAARFMKQFSDYRFEGIASKKRARAEYAHLQNFAK